MSQTLGVGRGATLAYILGTFCVVFDLAKGASNVYFLLHIVQGPHNGGVSPTRAVACDGNTITHYCAAKQIYDLTTTKFQQGPSS